MTDKKEQIVNAAIGLFAEQGFEGSSIRELAARANVNVAMINYYFGTKEKLFEYIVAEKASYTRGLLDKIVTDKSLSEIEKMDEIVNWYVHRLIDNRLLHRVIFQELMLNTREPLQDAIVNNLFSNSKLIIAVIESGIKKGIFKKVDPPMVVASIVGTVNQILLSSKMCNKLLGRDNSYIPYEDSKFIKRVNEHLQQMIRTYLLKKQ